MRSDWCHRRAGDLRARVPADSRNPFAVALERGELYVELYCPEGTDWQQPHERDECYFVVEGEGEFLCGEERVRFAPGDFLFVPAGVTHRFENFGARMRVWVVFYGPAGGADGFHPPETGPSFGGRRGSFALLGVIATTFGPRETGTAP